MYVTFGLNRRSQENFRNILEVGEVEKRMYIYSQDLCSLPTRNFKYFPSKLMPNKFHHDL